MFKLLAVDHVSPISTEFGAGMMNSYIINRPKEQIIDVLGYLRTDQRSTDPSYTSQWLAYDAISLSTTLHTHITHLHTMTFPLCLFCDQVNSEWYVGARMVQSGHHS